MLVDTTGITDISQNGENQKIHIRPNDLKYANVIGQGNCGVVRKAFYNDTILAVKIINVYDREKRH